MRLEVHGLEHFPKSGAVVIASNHVTGYDPPLVGCQAPRACYYMAKKELFDHKLLRALIRFYRAIPIDRRKPSIQTIREVKRTLEKNGTILMFPEGTRTRDGYLQRPKDGIGLLLTQANAAVVPVYISGLFGKKAGFRLRPEVKIDFGKPVDLNEMIDANTPKRERYAAIADCVYDGIRTLALAREPERVLDKTEEQ